MSKQDKIEIKPSQDVVQEVETVEVLLKTVIEAVKEAVTDQKEGVSLCLTPHQHLNGLFRG